MPVPNSLVSAITHTPASGPFSPVTVPVMYPGGLTYRDEPACLAILCCALVGNTMASATKPTTPAHNDAVILRERVMLITLLNTTPGWLTLIGDFTVPEPV